MARIMNPIQAFHFKLKTLYDIEKQLEIALPKMAEAATHPDLEAGFLTHLEQTLVHSERLEMIFDMIDEAPEKHPGESIRGILAEGMALAESEAPDAVRDSLLAGAGRCVEHHEMASYKNAIEEAKGLGLSDAVDLLEMTLSEEETADENLALALQENLSLAAIEETEE